MTLTPVYNNVLARLTLLDATYLDLYFANVWDHGEELQHSYKVDTYTPQSS